MKIIIVLSFFGILTNAFRFLPNGITRCLYVGTKEGLETDRFFNGTWFVTHAKNGSSSTVCREYNGSKEDGKVKLIGDGYYNVGLDRNYLEVRCNGSEVKNEKQQFTLNCTQQTPSSQPFRFLDDFGLELTVIETDYENFAIIYLCTIFPQLGPFINDDLLILHRNISAVHPLVEIILLQKYKFELSRFRARKNDYCLHVPT
uniref:Putative triabin-like lipocalin n=1 Tax=Panstrongylus lignarius TaxID=156445 RepID=A0A224XKR3_9HEMI